MSFSSNYILFSFRKYIKLLFRPKLYWEEYIFPSSLLVSPFVKILLEPIRSRELSERIELGLHEALVNAVQHGHKNDSNKTIRVRRVTTAQWHVWQIQDEGGGVKELDRISQLPFDLASSSGRGLFLIDQCFDDIRWSKKGNRLQLACRRFNSNG